MANYDSSTWQIMIVVHGKLLYVCVVYVCV